MKKKKLELRLKTFQQVTLEELSAFLDFEQYNEVELLFQGRVIDSISNSDILAEMTIVDVKYIEFE